MKGIRKIAVLATAMLLLLTSCSGGNRVGSSASTMTEESMASGSYANDSALPMDMEFSQSTMDSAVYQNSGAKLIRRAELSIQTTEFDQAVKVLDQMVLNYGGYFETASVYGGSCRNAHNNRSGEYIVRIPGEQFTEFLASAGELGYVASSTKSSDDIGEQYYDTESRLKTQRTKQERLLNLLEQAATMEDIIDLENALSEVEYEIEQLSSTLNRYDALISYSTITVYLDEVSKVTEEVGETATLWQRMTAGFAASGNGLVEGIQNLLVWFAYNVFELFVLSVIIVFGAVIGVRVLKKREKKETTEAEEQQ